MRVSFIALSTQFSPSLIFINNAIHLQSAAFVYQINSQSSICCMITDNIWIFLSFRFQVIDSKIIPQSGPNSPVDNFIITKGA